MANLIEKLVEQAKKMDKTIVLPETSDERVLRAADILLKENITNVILVGAESELKSKANEYGISIDNANIIDQKNYENIDEFVNELFELRKEKGMTIEQAKELLTTDPRYFGAMLVRKGIADGMVAGSSSPTADVLRAAIHVVKTKPGSKTVSSSMIMITKTEEFGENGVMVFADCGVVPAPTSEQLADIAISSAEKAKAIAGFSEPRVALLSFSTKGSASHPDVDKVQEAVRILGERNVNFEYDGELQFDAAVVPSVGSTKAPDSKIAGKANVLIFPDLESGNIGYKIAQRLSKAEAIGPLIQGLAKPVHDLSRGCSVEDIVNVSAIAAIEADIS